MKSFTEVYNEIKESATGSATTWSKSDFDKLAKALLNDYGYKTTVASTKGGELVKNDIEPVKMFRDGTIVKLLVDAGLDKCEATKIASEYEFSKVDGLYELISEILYNYMGAGKKFNFLTKENFNASLTINDIEETVSEYKTIRKTDDEPVETFKVETKAHKVLKAKSKAPKWLKKKFK